RGSPPAGRGFEASRAGNAFDAGTRRGVRAYSRHGPQSGGTSMRRSLAAAFVAALVLSAPCALADTTRTLRFEMAPPREGLYGVENRAGVMSVVRGSSEKVVAIATVHAESDELAQSIRLDAVKGKKGEPVLRVEYPLDRHTTYRYPTKGSGSSDSL